MTDAPNRKPILTIGQQIEHLKLKGVKFELCSETEAASYLRDKCNFFKLVSYRKLFSKYEGGPRLVGPVRQPRLRPASPARVA